jgi:branched-chain amino acid transport system substrate-binding protein
MHRIIHLDPDLAVLPEPLRELVTACLSKDPAQRPSAHAVLLRLLGGMGAPAPAGAGSRIEPTLTRGATVATSDTNPQGQWQTPVPPYDARQVTTPPPAPLTTPPPAPPAPLAPPAPPRRARRRLLAVGIPAAVALAVLVAFTGYALLGRDGGTASDTPKTVQIGFAGALTGEYAPLVQPMLNGARLAVKEYNAADPRVTVKLVTVDTQGKAELAATAVRRLVSDGVVAVIGPPFSGESETAGPILEQAKIPSIATSATGRALSSHGWRFWHRLVPSDQAVARSTAEFLVRSVKPKRVFVVDDELKYSQALAGDVTTTLEGRGVEVTHGRISAGADDFSATVGKIRKAKADVVFYGGAYQPAARLVKQTHAAGVKARFSLSDAALAANFVGAAGGDSAEGTVIACSCFDASQGAAQSAKDFRQRYQTEFGSTPGYYTAEGYDAANAFLTALKSGQATGEAINGHLSAVDLGGASRRVKFAPNGDPAQAMVYVYRVRNSRIELLGDASTAMP